jgi:hypothetical protein
VRPFREEGVGWVGHGAQTVVRHLEDADLAGRAEAVLDPAQHPETGGRLQREGGVDDVLDDLRPGDRALLRHVADQHQRAAGGLGGLHQEGGGVADLGERAGGCALLGRQGLDRVDDRQRGRLAGQVIGDRVRIGAAQQFDVPADAEARGAQLDLRR